MGQEVDRQVIEAALVQRVEEAREAAERARDDAEVRDLVGRDLVVRCAWCGRFRVEGEWVVAVQPSLGYRQEYATHGICDDCAQALREAGMSV